MQPPCSSQLLLWNTPLPSHLFVPRTCHLRRASKAAVCSVWPPTGTAPFRLEESLKGDFLPGWPVGAGWHLGARRGLEPLHDHMGFLTAWRLVPGGQGGIFMTHHRVLSGSHKGPPRFPGRGPRTPSLGGERRGPRGACEVEATAQPSLGNTACHTP